MGKTRGQVKAEVQTNLTDLNINFYSDDDINNSIQDAYSDVVILTQCIQKQVTLPWVSNLSYYDFVNRFNISDYLGTIAIFNNVSNLWLRDDLSLKDFDRIRRDWENWIGTTMFWAPSDPFRIGICPKMLDNNLRYGAFDANSFNNDAFFINNSAQSNLGSFILYYWGLAPILVSDNDTFLIASDKDTTLTQYATADLLEQAQEFNKAGSYWGPYYTNVDDYADRVKRNCKADLLLRI
jgi:hypothetical protein